MTAGVAPPDRLQVGHRGHLAFPRLLALLPMSRIARYAHQFLLLLGGFACRPCAVGRQGGLPSGETLGGVVLTRLHYFGRALPLGANVVAAGAGGPPRS